jgi:hypothetical protein
MVGTYFAADVLDLMEVEEADWSLKFSTRRSNQPLQQTTPLSGRGWAKFQVS